MLEVKRGDCDKCMIMRIYFAGHRSYSSSFFVGYRAIMVKMGKTFFSYLKGVISYR